MATKKQPVMEWTDDHDILLLREMIATELFQFKKGRTDRGKIWESIQERLNKLNNPKFMIKEKRGVRETDGICFRPSLNARNEKSYKPVALIASYLRKIR